MKKVIYNYFYLFIILIVAFNCQTNPETNKTPAISSEEKIPDKMQISGTGNIEGYAFFNSENNKIIISSNNSAQTGFSPLNNATASISGQTETIKTDVNGHFLLEKIKPGLQKLIISNDKGNKNEFPVTVITDATINPGEAKIKQDEALNLLKNKFISEKLELKKLLIMGPKHPLPKGVIVASALGNFNGEPDQANAFRLNGNYWFFYVDPSMEQQFQHSVKYYFVNADSGEIVSRDGTSWPLINTLSYYEEYDDETLKSEDLIQLPSERPDNTQAINIKNLKEKLFSVLSHVPGSDCPDAQTFVLIIQGDKGGNFAGSAAEMNTFLQAQGVPAGNITQFQTFNSLDPEHQMLGIMEALYTKMRPCDTFYLYITTHSSKTPAFYFQKLGDPDLFNKTRNPLFSSDKIVMLASTFQIIKCPACHVTIVIQSCYSGGYITGEGFNNFSRVLDSKPGVQALIMTSSAAEKPSTGYTGPVSRFLWLRPRRAGGSFTQDFIDAHSDSSADINGDGKIDTFEAFTKAKKDNLSEEPQFWSSTWAGETCGYVPTPTPSPSPSRIPRPTPTPSYPSIDFIPDHGFNYFTPEPTATAKASPSGTVTASPTASPAVTVTASPTASPVPTATASPYVYLDFTLGIKAGDDPNCVELIFGTRISLSNISGGRVAPPEGNCDFYHLHGTITVGSIGPCQDPNPTGCGFGKKYPQN
jgi:hypothetical protein